MDYYIKRQTAKRNTAGTKAPEDVYDICKRRGMKSIGFPCFPENINVLFQKIWLFVVGNFCWIKVFLRVRKGDTILYQHPTYAMRIANKYIPLIKKRKKVKMIVLIHDLESLRRGIDGVIAHNERTTNIADNQFLKNFDYVICHNQKMKEYLEKTGIDERKIVILGIFDYLTRYGGKEKHELLKSQTIAIAGNLAIGKSGYIYNLSEKSDTIKFNLYGPNFEKRRCNRRLVYKGSFTPEEIPEKLEGNFGLVWDGKSVETCEGNTGNYLRYNNPHKASLYLSSNMPIIVWSQAAMADFVISKGVGMTVESLLDIENLLNSMSQEEYAEICKNVTKVGEQIRKGFFLNTALDKVFNMER